MHDEEAAGHPEEDDDDGDHAHADTGALDIATIEAATTVAAIGATALAAEHTGDALVEVAPELVQVGRAVIIAGRFFGPFVAVISVILIVAVVVL